MGNTDIALPGIDNDTLHLTNNKSDSAEEHKCQCEKLAEHTVVHPRYGLCKVTMTAVMHTVGTLSRCCRLAVFM